MTAFRDILQTRSLRFWIAAGMLLALAPVVTAAVIGFVVLNHGAIASFQDVADRQATQIVPAQHIGLMLWDTAITVDEFVESGNPTHQAGFRAGRTEVETEFATLLTSLSGEPVAHALVSGAYDDWQAAEALGNELISVLRPAGDPETVELMERFDGAIHSASDSIYAAIERLQDDIEKDRLAADLSYERSLWLAGIGAGICLLTIVAGVFLIGRVMVASVDRLVDGAMRFANGDRTHRIDIRVPPELRRVANEFNRMIGKIVAYEDVLSDRALKDVLTDLPNRRAFEEAFDRQWQRAAQSGEPFALLLIDVDHFKNINDTHGHTAGDQVLKQVARTFSSHLEAVYPAFRTGGEEFMVLVPHADITDAATVAEQLRSEVEAASVQADGRAINVTVSIGASDSAHAGSKGEMVAAADAALYEAKVNGRNRVATSGTPGTSRESAG